MDEDFDPIEKLDEIRALLDDLAVKYEIHYHDEGEYSYLEDGCVCVTVINQNADRPLYIDLDYEFTIAFGHAWHMHFDPDPEEFDALKGKLIRILKNEEGIVEFFSAEEQKWLLGSSAATEDIETGLVLKEPWVRNILKNYKWHQIEVFFLFWDPSLNKTRVLTRPQLLKRGK